VIHFIPQLASWISLNAWCQQERDVWLSYNDVDVLWDVVQCRLVGSSRGHGEACCPLIPRRRQHGPPKSL